MAKKELTAEDRAAIAKENRVSHGILFNVEKYITQGMDRSRAMERVARNISLSGTLSLADARKRVAKEIEGDLAVKAISKSKGPPIGLSPVPNHPSVPVTSLSPTQRLLMNDRNRTGPKTNPYYPSGPNYTAHRPTKPFTPMTTPITQEKASNDLYQSDPFQIDDGLMKAESTASAAGRIARFSRTGL